MAGEKSGPQQGPPLEDAENVYRAILYPLQWAEEHNRPSSAAFDDEVFSVEIKSRTSPEATAARKRMVLNIVEFNCGNARTHEFDSRDERDDKAPNNQAHAHVYFLGVDKKRKAKARQLAKACLIVPIDKHQVEIMRVAFAR